MCLKTLRRNMTTTFTGLREFLEPEDTDIPTEFLGHSVREVLETPFVRVARRWVGRGRVRCLLNLVDRAMATIRSLTGCPDEDPTIADVPLRGKSAMTESRGGIGARSSMSRVLNG